LSQSVYKPTIRPSPLQFEWFTIVESDQSIQRVVTLKGYPKIPGGNNTCDLVVSNPCDVQRDQRMLTDGRVWLGEISAKAINIIVN
ncbi:MAG: hypothetical protein V1800_11550, partial [Candidatus Latescibacterota bacterium]